MAHGYMKKCSGQQIDKDLCEDAGGKGDGLGAISFGDKVVLPKSGGFSKNRYGILITAKDTDYEDDDDDICDSKKLPGWMDLETLYLFPYEQKDDAATFEQKISTKEMKTIEYQDDSATKEGYTFRVETEDKVFFYACRTATECKKFVEILNKSKKTIEELQRTKFN
jgi:hypothetical protein